MKHKSNLGDKKTTITTTQKTETKPHTPNFPNVDSYLVITNPRLCDSAFNLLKMGSRWFSGIFHYRKYKQLYGHLFSI